MHKRWLTTLTAMAFVGLALSGCNEVEAPGEVDDPMFAKAGAGGKCPKTTDWVVTDEVSLWNALWSAGPGEPGVG